MLQKNLINRWLLIPLLLLLTEPLLAQQKQFTISGFVREETSDEPLLGVTVYVKELDLATVTNAYGFYSITLPAGDSITLLFTYVGYQAMEARIRLDKDYELTMQLESAGELKELVVKEDKDPSATEQPQMSHINIPVYAVKTLPALFGEKDALKIIQLMPGVQKGSEGQSGLYVRGGGPDQNLIILDDATVYNAFHLFGFFSLFNGDAIRSIELTKGGFPARYGGRLSSVIDINMKEGNKEEIHGEGGIGIISSRLTLEGPIQKGKSSFLFTGRRTYLDILIQPFVMVEGINAGYFFHDFTGKINYDFGKKDKVYLSAYQGKDKFYLRESYDGDLAKANISWGNFTSTLRWNHVHNNKTFMNTSLIYTRYRMNIGLEQEYDNDKFTLNFFSGIRDLSLKFDMDYLPNPKHTVRTGFQGTWHTFTPNALVIKESSSNFDYEEKEAYQSMENGIYVQDDIRLSSRWRVLAGLRFSHFIAGNYQTIRPEPRISSSYMIRSTTSVKASYAEMNQYVHLLSNTGVGLPTDLWVPATERVKPQRSRQVAAGFSQDIKKFGLTASLEGYYKRSFDVINYQEGSSFLAIDDPVAGTEVLWEDNITSGSAESYGAEFLLEKRKGRFSGWVGYTLSWTWMMFPELNNGRRFHPKYDRRHDISVVGMFKISDNITLSGTWVYGTGNAISLPLADYNQHLEPLARYSAGQASWYGDKNSFRMGAYHRFDMALQISKQMKRYERTWEISVYNLYNRKNPFFYYIDYGSNRNVLKQVSLFPIIPSISWNFKF